MVRIFIVGMNRSGTLSLHKFLQTNGVNSFHWRTEKGSHPEGNIAYVMAKNIESNRPILSGLEKCESLSDINFVTKEHYLDISRGLFEKLYEEHPDDLYILNTRPTDRWLLSRLRHQDFVERCLAQTGLDLIGLVEMWAEEKTSYESKVLGLLEGKENFLHFHLGVTTGEELSDFLSTSYTIRRRTIPHTHKGKRLESRDIMKFRIARLFSQ